MKELSIYYQYNDEQDIYQIPLNNYIEESNIQDLEVETIIQILLHEQIEFDRNDIKVFNSESGQWEGIEHFYVQVEELFEEDSCYCYDNGVRLQIQKIQQYQFDNQQQLLQLQNQQLDQQQFQEQSQDPNQNQNLDQQTFNGMIYQELLYINSRMNQFFQDLEIQKSQNIQNISSIQSDLLGVQNYLQQLNKQLQNVLEQGKNVRINTGNGTQTNKSTNKVNQFGNIIEETPSEKPIILFPLEDKQMEESQKSDEVNFFGDLVNPTEDIFQLSSNINNKQEETPTASINSNIKTNSDLRSIFTMKQPKSESIVETDKSINKSPMSSHVKFKSANSANINTLIAPTTPIMKPPSTSFQIIHGISSFSNSSQIRMSIMYSEPLVVRKNKFIYPAGEPVEYEQEILQLTRYFQKCKNNGEINIRVANLDNLEEEIINSQIIHISCHGDFHKEYQKYYLQFEEKNCEIKCVTTEQFKTLLQNKKEKPKLTFVNACHSEEVGLMFLNSGIPFVVAVQSNLKIQDKAAQIFSNSFYMGLMKKYTIRQAFNSAKDALIAKHHQACYTCCCAHQHTDKCEWLQYAMDHGYQEAHKLHEQYSCECYNPSKSGSVKNPIYHKQGCNRIMEFFKVISDDNKLDEIFELPLDQPIYGCCCQGESTTHDESAKFKLLCLNDTLDYTFNFEKGEMNIKYNFDMYNSNFKSQFKLFGRNVEMYEIFNSLNDCSHNSQFVVVYGERGSGLTSISKKVARHLKEREVVNEIIIEDFENVDRGISKFKTKLKKFKNGKEGSQPYYTLMILDNCDDLINKNLEDFTKQLSDTSLNVKFIIITHFKPNLKLNEAVINYIELKPLDKKTAFDIISHHIGNQIRNFANDEQFSNTLDQILDKRTILPKFVMEIVQSIKNGSNLQDLLVSQDPLELIMKKLKENNSKYEMLLVISLFPHGVSVEDLKYLASKKKIPSDWEEIMLQLTSKEIIDPNLALNLYETESEENSDIEPNSATDISSITASISSHSSEHHHFKIGQYFWMSVSKNELQFIQFKIKKNIPRWLYSKEQYSRDLLQKEVLILEYLSYFAKKMLNCIKSDRYQKLKMVDYSSIVDFGLFKVAFKKDWFQNDEDNDNYPDESQTNGQKLPKLNRGYSENFEEHIFKKYRNNLESLFKLHEQNLYLYLKKEDLMNLIEFMNSSYCHEKRILKEALKDLCVDIPSIHKLLDHKEDALEQCEKAINILDQLIKYPDNLPFLLAKLKIQFIQANLYFDQFDFQTKNQEEFRILLKQFKCLNDSIQSLANHPEFRQQKNILLILQAEKVFFVTYTIKVMVEQKLIKYLHGDYDLSQINDLLEIITSKRIEENFTNLKDLCSYLINQLSQYSQGLLKIDGCNLEIQNIKDNQILLIRSIDYLNEAPQTNLDVLISKIKFVTACFEGFQFNEEFNEEYVESIQESIKAFSQYSLNELKEQCLKQFAKQFWKNKTLQKQTKSETIPQRIESEIIKHVKSGPKENLTENIKETFEKAYDQLKIQDSKDYKISIQTSA
ncbi:hypothetical protein ABPG72_015056 [Tetrahymena utriculariae]